MDTIDKIERLQKLLSSGAITQEEYESQKQKILNDSSEEKEIEVPKGLEEKEKSYFKNKGIHITNTRAIFPNKTYAMANITSVSIGEEKQDRTVPITIIVIGVIGLTFFPEIGFPLILVGTIWIYMKKKEYSVKIGSSSGEIEGFTSKNRELVRKVVSAMNDAIIDRG